MPLPLSRAEAMLLAAVAAMFLVAVLGPAVSQPGDYHLFADQRVLWQVPMAMDVLSNFAFVMAGVLGGVALRQARTTLSNVQRAMAALFFVGLLLVAAGSAWYHRAPDAAGLALDRSAMAVAFAGLLGLAAASRVSERAGAWLGLVALAMGPVAAQIAFATGNVLPWAALQFGGMAMVVFLALRPTRVGTLPVTLVPVLLAYSIAKLLEMNDHQVFELTGQWISGHTFKHVVAALAAAPVILVLRGATRSGRKPAQDETTTRAASSQTANHA